MKSLVLTDNQKIIAENRYLKIDKNGKPTESIEEMFKRISIFIASNEKNYNKSKSEIRKIADSFFEIQSSFKFLSGFTLADRGRNQLMAACYVLPLEDSLESIYRTLYEGAQLHRLGAGIGYDFSKIRPENDIVLTTGKKATGPISFMRLFDFSSEIILNKGSVRHAGHMGILRIDHPDIKKFIYCKSNPNELTNFNISVAITDDFIEAYKNKKPFSLINPRTQKSVSLVDPEELLADLAKSAHKSGEPGLIFIDEINRKNNLIKLGKITATNLCGEQPLLPYESCNLGSIVLTKFFKKNNDKNINNKIDWADLEKTVRIAVRFLDNTIDLQYYTIPEIEKIVRFGNRKIGLGLMGWADLLFLLEIPYDSNEARILAKKLMKFITETGRDESQKIGFEKGSFGNFNKSNFPNMGFKKMRNATITTIAPNGTVSLFAEVTGGIEPVFSLVFVRKNMETLEGKELIIVNKVFENKLKEKWLYSKELIFDIAKSGSIDKINQLPRNLKEVFKTAHLISPKDHLLMQAAFQEFTDNAVSKTINLSENVSVNEIKKLFEFSFDLGIKGLTIYRDKSRENQVLN